MAADDAEPRGREVLVDETQRDAERTALRRVRGVLDDIEKQDRATARTGRRMAVVAGVLIVLFVVLVLVMAGRSRDFQGPPLVIPSAQSS